MPTPILWEHTLGCSRNVETIIDLSDPNVDLAGATARLEFIRHNAVIFGVDGVVAIENGTPVARHHIAKDSTASLAPGGNMGWRVIVGTALDRIIVAKGPLTLIAPVATAP